MATLIRSGAQIYYYLNYEIADPRVNHWFLMSTPWLTLSIIGLYLYFVFDLGPKFMRNRPPYKLHRTMQIYNVIQILCNGYLFYKALVLGWLWDYSFRCEPVDWSHTPRAIEIASTVWLYFIIKIIDLFDTIVFVLRKKNNQISFLHVYHHAGMVAGSWAGTKLIPGGHATFIGLMNSLVHVVMYSHYLLTSFKVDKPFWKKYITQLQIIQFFLILFHMLQLFWVDCGYPIWPALFMIPQNLFMLILFSDFYYKTYIKKRTPKVEQNKINEETANGKNK